MLSNIFRMCEVAYKLEVSILRHQIEDLSLVQCYAMSADKMCTLAFQRISVPSSSEPSGPQFLECFTLMMKAHCTQ